MTIDRVDFASLLASRLCHDLLSPVGAFANGLELLADEKDPEMRARCIELLEQSARTSTSKLKFFRLAFGSAGGFGDEVPPDEAKAAIEGILAHPELELVGCWVHGASKDGRDVGEILGRAPLGVRATRDADALLALEADCVLYAPVVANPAEVRRILESGKNVVTPLGWFYPFHAKSVAEMEAACRKGGVSLHGTGIHPGGITERFPLAISSLSRAITHVRAEEWSDIRTYGAPQVIGDVMLFGKTPEEAARSPMLQLLSGGFLQSIDMLIAALGFDERFRRMWEYYLVYCQVGFETGLVDVCHVRLVRARSGAGEGH